MTERGHKNKLLEPRERVSGSKKVYCANIDPVFVGLMPFHHNRYQDFVQNSQTLGAKYVLVKNDTCKFCISLSNWSLYLFIVSCKFSSLNLMSSGRNKATLPEPDGPKIAILGYGVSSSKTGNNLARFIKYCSKYCINIEAHFLPKNTWHLLLFQYQNQYRLSVFLAERGLQYWYGTSNGV